MYTVTMKEMSNSRIENARNQAAAYRQVRQAQQPKGNPVQRAAGMVSGLLAYAWTGVKPGQPVSQNYPV